MGLLLEWGFTEPKTVERLNWVQKYKGIVLSDAALCGGHIVKPWVLENSLSYTFFNLTLVIVMRG